MTDKERLERGVALVQRAFEKGLSLKADKGNEADKADTANTSAAGLFLRFAPLSLTLANPDLRVGLERKGYLSNGQYGLDKDGYDAQGRNLQNLDRQGYSPEGFSAEGYNRDGLDRNGLNKDGVDRNGNGCTSNSSDTSSSNPEDAAKLGLPPLQDKFGAAFLGTSNAAQLPAAETGSPST
ncbi:hypothetical protein JCM10908_002975 [Rhodotorula pacifica]|uniref:uncharacterized protein n=1 Tax=Rhodotorula pacifica TaxID=1495444 RepID=UPI003175AD66